MHLFYLAVWHHGASGHSAAASRSSGSSSSGGWTRVAEADELSSFGFFQRGTMRQFARFYSETMVQRTAPGDHVGIDGESTWNEHNALMAAMA